jgi:N4-gp56 family major capsid protein
MGNLVTKLANLINPQVMAQMISAKVENKVRFMPYVKLDTTLQGQSGDTITVPKYGYIGDAVDVAEGEEIPTRQLSVSSEQHTVKKIGIGGIITDEAVLSGYGNPQGTLTSQLATSITQKLDSDVLEELYGTKTFFTSTDVLSYETLVNAIDVFNEEENTDKVMWVHPHQVTQLRLDPNFISKDKYQGQVTVDGEIGTIANTRIIPSKKVMLVEYVHDTSGTEVTTDNLKTYEGKTFPSVKVGDKVKAVTAKYYANPIVKLNGDSETEDDTEALTCFLKRDTNVETERQSKFRQTEVTGDKIYVMAVTNEKKIVIAKTLQVKSV